MLCSRLFGVEASDVEEEVAKDQIRTARRDQLGDRSDRRARGSGKPLTSDDVAPIGAFGVPAAHEGRAGR